MRTLFSVHDLFGDISTEGLQLSLSQLRMVARNVGVNIIAGKVVNPSTILQLLSRRSWTIGGRQIQMIGGVDLVESPRSVDVVLGLFISIVSCLLYTSPSPRDS